MDTYHERRTWWTDTVRVVAALLDDHPDLPLPYILNQLDRQVIWYAHTAAEVQAVRAVLGQGTPVAGGPGIPTVAGEAYGFRWKLARLDLKPTVPPIIADAEVGA